MAYKITSSKCTGCSKCKNVCPDKAIVESRLPDPDECQSCDVCIGFDCDIFSEGTKTYIIEPGNCTECINSSKPVCIDICPVKGCIKQDTDHKETKEQLIAKSEKLHQNKSGKKTERS
ncbi:MAG: 4Fe-4S binding protein [Chloroflexi bacterium]|nr:4Fe-4S binding protein [Chloroflexota bacterium]